MQGTGLGTLERRNLFKQLLNQLQALPEFKVLDPFNVAEPTANIEELSAEVSRYEHLSPWQRWWSSQALKNAYAQKHKADVISYLRHLSNKSLDEQLWELQNKLTAYDSQSSWSKWWQSDLLIAARNQQYERVYTFRAMQLLDKQMDAKPVEIVSHKAKDFENAAPAQKKISWSIPYLFQAILDHSSKLMMPSSAWNSVSGVKPHPHKSLKKPSSPENVFKRVMTQVYNLFTSKPVTPSHNEPKKVSNAASHVSNVKVVKNPLNAVATDQANSAIPAPVKGAVDADIKTINPMRSALAINPVRVEAIKDYRQLKSRQGSGNAFVFSNEDHEGNANKIMLIIRLLGIDVTAPADKAKPISERVKSHLRSFLVLIHPDKREAKNNLLEAYGLDAETCDNLIREFSELKIDEITILWSKYSKEAEKEGASTKLSDDTLAEVIHNEYAAVWNEVINEYCRCYRESIDEYCRYSREATDEYCRYLRETTDEYCRYSQEMTSQVVKRYEQLAELTARDTELMKEMIAQPSKYEALQSELNEMYAMLSVLAAKQGIAVSPAASIVFGKQRTPEEASNTRVPSVISMVS